MDELDADVARDRAAHVKKPLEPEERNPKQKGTRVSTMDPDSGYMFREGKQQGFFYLEQCTVDGGHNIITDVHVSAGKVRDNIPYHLRLNGQWERFGFAVEAVGLDAGCFTPAMCKVLVERELYGVMPY